MYKQIDAKNIEENVYFAYVEQIHKEMMIKLMRNGIIPPGDLTAYSEMVKNRWISRIWQEIRKLKPLKTSNDKSHA